MSLTCQGDVAAKSALRSENLAEGAEAATVRGIGVFRWSVAKRLGLRERAWTCSRCALTAIANKPKRDFDGCAAGFSAAHGSTRASRDGIVLWISAETPQTTVHLRPNVEAERLPPARRLGREANDATGRLAAQVPCRWQSARATG